MRSVDLEEPYHRAAKLDEKYQAHFNQHLKTLWDEMTDNLEAEKLVADYEPNLEAKMIEAIACAKKEIGEIPQDKHIISAKLYSQLIYMINEKLEQIADYKADKSVWEES